MNAAIAAAQRAACPRPSSSRSRRWSRVTRHARREHRRRQPRCLRARIAAVLISIPRERPERAVVLRLDAARARGRLPARARRARGADLDQHQPRHQRPRARRLERGQPLDRRRARAPGPLRLRRRGQRRPGQGRVRRRHRLDHGARPLQRPDRGARARARHRVERRRQRHRDLSENELEIWYGAQDRFAVQVKPPGLPWTEAVEPGEFIENRRLPDGSYLSVYNELYHPRTATTTSPSTSARSSTRPISSASGRPVAGPADRPRGARRPLPLLDRARRPAADRPDRQRDAWLFPSFFSGALVRRPSDGQLARLRAADRLGRQPGRRRPPDQHQQQPGPDARRPPEARHRRAGHGHRGARGASTPNSAGSEMTGTSMASPHVAGVVGLMLAVNPRLTAAQIGGILQRTAPPLPGADFTWRDDAGSAPVRGRAASRRPRSPRAPRPDQVSREADASSRRARATACCSPARTATTCSSTAACRTPTGSTSRRPLGELAREATPRPRLRLAHRRRPHRRRAAAAGQRGRVAGVRLPEERAKNAHAKAEAAAAAGGQRTLAQRLPQAGRPEHRADRGRDAGKRRAAGGLASPEPTWRTPRTCASSRPASTRRSGSRGG